jgi:hypothetical protein
MRKSHSRISILSKYLKDKFGTVLLIAHLPPLGFFRFQFPGFTHLIIHRIDPWWTFRATIFIEKGKFFVVNSKQIFLKGLFVTVLKIAWLPLFGLL